MVVETWLIFKTFLVSRIHIFLSLSKVKKGYIKFWEFCKCSPGLSHIDHDQMLSLIVSINSTNTIVPATLTLVKLDSKPYHHIWTESFPVNINYIINWEILKIFENLEHAHVIAGEVLTHPGKNDLVGLDALAAAVGLELHVLVFTPHVACVWAQCATNTLNTLYIYKSDAKN